MILKSRNFKDSRGNEKKIYPCLIVDFLKTTWQTRDKIRKEMDDLMYNQGFLTMPKFVDVDGNIIIDNISVIDINDKYPGFKWVFYVEEKNLDSAKRIASKYKVDFYE
jgi:hypothetical protein